MRLRTVVRGLLILAVLVWLGYAVAGIGWSYWVTQEVVDKTLRDGTARYRRTTASGGPTEGLASYLRASIAMAARHEGLAIHEQDIEVSSDPARVSATVHWSHPVFSYGGRDILVIPMSLERSFVSPP
jgi:hypothetical protein